MKRMWFWLLLAILTAVATHLGYVLYGPRYVMGRFITDLAGAAPVNSFSALPRDVQTVFFPDDPSGVVRGVCPFALGGAALQINAALPDEPWVAVVYGANGAVAYVLNREQAGTSDITITIRPAKGLSSITAPVEREGGINDGWTLEAADDKGIATIMVMLTNPLNRARSEETLRKSRCRLLPQA